MCGSRVVPSTYLTIETLLYPDLQTKRIKKKTVPKHTE